jgi:hypothetical protein
MPDAPKILLRNVYGWFERVERGCYRLSDRGRAELARWTAEQSAGAGRGRHKARRTFLIAQYWEASRP